MIMMMSILMRVMLGSSGSKKKQQTRRWQPRLVVGRVEGVDEITRRHFIMGNRVYRFIVALFYRTSFWRQFKLF